MFGYCLWYRYVGWLPDINMLIRAIGKQLKGHPFVAHITIRSCLKNCELNHVRGYYNAIPKPFFTVGKLEQTMALGSRGKKFYALQRSLYLNGSKMQVSTYHMSFAYRDSIFTEQEIQYVNTMTKNIHKINAQDLSLELWNCQGDPAVWQAI